MGKLLPVEEFSVISRIAQEYGLDVHLLIAIRKTENGGPGREFGVLSQTANDFEAQCRIAALSLRNSMYRFCKLRQEEWIKTFAARWAPHGAENDPHGLNDNWIANFTSHLNDNG